MEHLIDQYLEEADIPANKQYDENGDPIYAAEFELESGTFQQTIIVSSEYENVTLFLYAPINVPPPKRPEIAEYIGRANYHGYEGNFIMDYADGSLAYKNSLRYDPDGDNALIRYQLNISLVIGLEEMQTHFPGILSVIYQDVAPEDAHHKAMLGTQPKLN